MQKDFVEYKNESDKIATEAKSSHALLEKTPWAFILIGVAISAAATYFLGEMGLKNSDLYKNLIGAENTAGLVVAIIEGSLIALIVGMTTFLKSAAQRKLGAMGINVLKGILCANVLTAFAIWVTKGKESSNFMGLIEVYAQWGTPITICGALWFWPKILSLRHQDLQRAAVLDTNAKMADEWRKRLEQDQQNYLNAYGSIQDSDEMMEMQKEIAQYEAIQQLAKERGIPFEDAQLIFDRARMRKRGGEQRQFGTTVQKDRQYLAPPSQPLPVAGKDGTKSTNFYDPTTGK